MENRHILKVGGMTCSSCEMLIKGEVEKLPGIKSVSANAQTGEVAIEHGGQLDSERVKNAINKLGYKVGGSNSAAKGKATDWLYAGGIVLVLALAWQMAKQLGLFDLVSYDPSRIGYGSAFVVGIAASMSTCLMVVGSVVIAFSTAAESHEHKLKTQLMFHAGRIATFFILGGLLGLVGSYLKLSGKLWGVLAFVVAFIMAWLALSTMGLLKGMRMGKWWNDSVAPVWSKAIGSRKPWAPMLIGALTFILPCGFTQSMQLFAISTGSFWQGALTLGLFALGTFPVLLALGMGTSSIKEKFNSGVVQKVLGILILLFALYIAKTGLGIFGVVTGAVGTKTAAVQSQQGNEQVIEMTVDGGGYRPSNFTLKEGVPVLWKIHGVYISGCTRQIKVPDFNVLETLVKGENEIRFTPTKTGTIGFSCGMGMITGSFNVVPNDGKAADCKDGNSGTACKLNLNTDAAIEAVADLLVSPAEAAVIKPVAKAVTVKKPALKKTVAVAKKPAAKKSVPAVPVEQTIILDADNYAPAVMTVKPGQPIKLIARVKVLYGCNDQLVIVEKQSVTDLHKGDNVFHLPALKPGGSYQLTCGMNMQQARIVANS